MSSEDVERGLLEAKSTAAFQKKLGDEYMNFEDAKILLALTASTPDTVEDWLAHIHHMEEAAEERGANIPLPTYAEKATICPECNAKFIIPGQPGTFRKLNFWDFPDTRRRFVDAMLVDFNARVNSISDIGRMAVFNDEGLLYSPFYDFNPQSLIYAFRHRREGILATVSGTMGVGKTDFTLRITEELLASEKPAFNVITNIWLKPKTLEAYKGRLIYENNMRGLLRTLCLKARDPTRHAVVPLDETSMFFSRREPGKKTNVLLEKFIRLIRKYNASLIFIDQQRDGLPGPALELRTVMYHKTDLTKVHYVSGLGSRNYSHYLSHVPKTSLGYDTKRIGFFDYNMDLDGLFTFNDEKEQLGIGAVESTLMYLDWLDLKHPVQDSFEVRVLKYIEDNPGCIQKELAAGVGLDPEDGANTVRITRLITQLDDRGEIERDKDGRAKRLYICNNVTINQLVEGNKDTG